MVLQSRVIKRRDKPSQDKTPVAVGLITKDESKWTKMPI